MLVGNFGGLENSVLGNSLEGYGWFNTDLVIGGGGLEKIFSEYHSLTISDFLSNFRDGRFNLFIDETLNSDAVLSTDSMGYGKIFLYEGKSLWAASSSWIDLVKFLKKNNVELTPNTAVFEHLMGRWSFNEQLASFETAIQEIKLLPHWKQICFSKKTWKYRITDSTVFYSTVDEAEQSTYEHQLAAWLGRWKGRIETIGKSNLRTLVDVSGGIDSRVGLSLIKSKKESFIEEKLRFRTSPGYPGSRDMSMDQRVSYMLGNILDIPISEDFFYRPREIKSKGAEGAWGSFEYSQIGTYKPINFNSGAGLSDLKLRIAGGAGENYRSFHKVISSKNKLAEFIDDRVKDYMSEENKKSSKNAFLSFFDNVPSCLLDENDLMKSHYISFRNRFHFGTNILNQIYLYPLSDLSLLVSYMKYKKKGGESSVYLDLMFNLNQIVPFLPFDKEDKGFTVDEIENIKKVSDENIKVDTPGSVYFSDLTFEHNEFVMRSASDVSDIEASSVVDIFIFKAEAAFCFLNKNKPDFLLPSFLEKASESIEEIKRHKRVKERQYANDLYMLILMGVVYGAFD